MSLNYDINSMADKWLNEYQEKEIIEKKVPVKKEEKKEELTENLEKTEVLKEEVKEEKVPEVSDINASLDKKSEQNPDMQRGGSGSNSNAGTNNNEGNRSEKEEVPEGSEDVSSKYEDEKNVVEVDLSESVKSITDTSKETNNSILMKAPEKPKIVSEVLKPVRYYTGDSVITVTEFIDTRSKAETRGVTSSEDDKARQVYVSGQLLDEICDFLKCDDVSASLLVNAILHYFIKSKLPINESCHDILKTVFNSKDDDMLKKVSESMDKVQKTVTTMRSESEDLSYSVLQAVVLMYLTYMGIEKEDNTDVRKFISTVVDKSTSGQFRHMVEQLSLSGLSYGQMARSRKYSNKTIAKDE